MRSLRIAAALAAGAMLVACDGEADLIRSEKTDPTSDQSTPPPVVETDLREDPSDSDEDEETDEAEDTDESEPS